MVDCGDAERRRLDGPSSRLRLRFEYSLGYLDIRGRALLSGMQVVCGGEEQEPQPIAVIFLRTIGSGDSVMKYQGGE